ncbi:hypothetical protein T03_13391 [Trichinella britovi]|uniref:Uncharacterized protein n=1 Tax=Trichinella britovi TaxID=45882 RepID=A0A0V1C7F5_TRIBR|nr:hypothetical protein T03_13391 [Trichinella britovi]
MHGISDVNNAIAFIIDNANIVVRISPKIGLQNAEAILLWSATITGVVFQDYEKFRRLCYLNVDCNLRTLFHA